MTEPHTIRLREPWQREPLSTGGIRYRRRFNLPTNLDSQETVWIVCDRPAGAVTIALNGVSLGSLPAGAAVWSCEVTHSLVAANELMIELPTAPQTTALPWGEVRLEIRGA